MPTILRFRFDIGNDTALVTMPRGAKLLEATIKEYMQNDPEMQASLFVEADPDQPLVIRKFRLYGTNTSLDADNPGVYFSTLYIAKGVLVKQVYDQGEVTSP